jgi:hypothetical protein
MNINFAVHLRLVETLKEFSAAKFMADLTVCPPPTVAM